MFVDLKMPDDVASDNGLEPKIEPSVPRAEGADLHSPSTAHGSSSSCSQIDFNAR